jgi:hypothetical protein
MLYIDDLDCDGACHLKNYSFVITYLLEDEQELSLGMLDTSQMYLYFLMLHACLHTICFVFCYTSWHFYAFSGTNLLTRCHSDSSLFSAVLCFREVTQEIFSELDETKAEPFIFTEASRRPKMRRSGARGQAHHRVVRPSPWPHHHMVRPGGPPPDATLSPIKSPRWEKPKGRIAFL